MNHLRNVTNIKRATCNCTEIMLRLEPKHPYEPTKIVNYYIKVNTSTIF